MRASLLPPLVRQPLRKLVRAGVAEVVEHGGIEVAPQLPANHFERLANFSFSRQISSINSVSTTIFCLSVTVHGFV